MSIAPAIGDVGFRRPLIAVLATAAGVIAVDQSTKVLTRASLEEWRPGPELGPFQLKYVEHDDGASGGHRGTPGVAVLGLALGGATAGIATMLGGFAPARHAGAASIAAGLVGGAFLGGAISNGVERLVRGSVTDMIRIDMPDPMSEPWIVANVADVAVGAGLVGAVAVAGGVGGIGAIRGLRALIRA